LTRITGDDAGIRPKRADLRRQGFEPILTTRNEHEAGSLPREGTDGFPADAGAGAGDNRDFSV